MTAGSIVTAPDGSRVTLVEIGQTVLLDNEAVRIWEVVLDPAEVQPWHLHHNPYVVLSLEASAGRMDWLDGSEPRYLDEYVGGAVYRPTSPVHRLTNIGERRYRNRLVEFKDLGEKREQEVAIGPGERSTIGHRPAPSEPDGRDAVLIHDHTKIWTIDVPASSTVDLELGPAPHVLATLEGPDLGQDPTGGTRYHRGGPLALTNDARTTKTWFVVELSYLPAYAVLTAATATDGI